MPALLLSQKIFAQAADSVMNKPVEMAGLMRSNGKIYVVVAVLVTILAGLAIYLLRLDNKISKLEKDLKP